MRTEAEIRNVIKELDEGIKEIVLTFKENRNKGIINSTTTVIPIIMLKSILEWSVGDRDYPASPYKELNDFSELIK